VFAWVGKFSSGLVGDKGFRLEKHLPGFVDHPDDVNRKLKLLFLSCGTEDPRYIGQLDLADNLKRHTIRYMWYPTPCTSGRCHDVLRQASIKCTQPGSENAAVRLRDKHPAPQSGKFAAAIGQMLWSLDQMSSTQACYGGPESYLASQVCP